MRLALVLLAAVLPLVAQNAAPAPQVDVLSTHQTDAVYEGTRHIPCRHRTALCPEKCGHAMDVAVFRITAYRSYVKHSPNHGDPEAKEFLLQLRPGEVASAEVLSVVRVLKVGAPVRLDWVHEYVRTESVSYPRRRVTQLTR